MTEATPGVTLNVSPMKNPLGRDNHGFNMLTCRSHKKFADYRIAPLAKKVPPGRRFIGKKSSRQSGRQAGLIYADKLSAGWGAIL